MYEKGVSMKILCVLTYEFSKKALLVCSILLYYRLESEIDIQDLDN